MPGNVLEGVFYQTAMQLAGSMIFVEVGVIGFFAFIVFMFPSNAILKTLVISGAFLLAAALEPGGALAYLGAIGGAFIVWSAGKRLWGN
jgi:hypothetical protein